MKTPYFFLIGALIIIACQTKKQVDYVLTGQDRKDYVLSIDQTKIIGPRDTTIEDTLYRIIHVPVQFKNNSSYKLSYIDVFTNELYACRINNTNLHFPPKCHLCDVITLDDVGSQKSVVFYIPVIYKKDSVASQQRFMLGINIQWFLSNKVPWMPNPLSKSTENIIWSNEVSIPGSN